MGTALIKIRIMPASLETDLEAIKKQAKEVIEQGKGERVNFEITPIAFGLKALIVGFDLDESFELEPIEEKLRKIQGVNSAEVIDMRRAFG